jgi:hypothetical protein
VEAHPFGVRFHKPFRIAITEPNFNILFVVGYALGKNKKIALFLNLLLSSERKEINEVGSFDSLEFRQYENSRELEGQLRACLRS